jgi:site-specific DNA-methyltransferase (adenine-specific)
MSNLFLNADCMDPKIGLPSYPDNHFDLAIVDPPYGIGGHGGFGQSKTKKRFDNGSKWDNNVPSNAYFKELARVSKDQIVWGGNYFDLGVCRCFVVWDKKQQGKHFADCEMAWTSFDQVARIVTKKYLEPYECAVNNTVKRIHPTQKSVGLYVWLLQNYAQPNDIILDTHVGSASSLIACESMGFNYVGYELDPDYYAAAQNRMSKGIQLQML